MKYSHIKNHTRRPSRKKYDIQSSEFNSSKNQSKKVINGHKFGDEIDTDYACYLISLTQNNEQSKSPMEEVIINEDENENQSESESAEEENDDDNDEVEDDDDDDDDEEDEVKDYRDPQYSMFLKELTANGKSYKLKISKKDESPCFLEYEQYDPSTYAEVINGNIKEWPKEDSRKMQTENDHNMTVDPCYQVFLNGSIPSEYGAFMYEGKRVNYEEKVTNSDSDSDSYSDILIWDNAKDFIEVNKNQPVSAKKEPSLKEKLMCILRKPYNKEEYKQLLENIEEQKPICRLLPLRDRAISSALDGATKSLLHDSPASFRRKLEAAQNDRPRVLNLLRMFYFWLEHLPDEKMFTPWLIDDFLQVLPSTRKRSCPHK